MNLTNRHQWRARDPSHRFGQLCAIANHCVPVIGLGKAEIQFPWSPIGTVNLADPAPSSAEAMPQPARPPPTWNREPFDAVRGHTRSGRHLREFLLRGSFKPDPRSEER